MQIAATDATIAFVLNPAEARALLARVDGFSMQPSLDELRARLSLFVDGPDDEPDADEPDGFNNPPMSDDEAAYYEEQERVHERLDAMPRVNGCAAVEESGDCESCGKTDVLYARDAYTLGHRGHPGAEITSFHVCKECLS